MHRAISIFTLGALLLLLGFASFLLPYLDDRSEIPRAYLFALGGAIVAVGMALLVYSRSLWTKKPTAFIVSSNYLTIVKPIVETLVTLGFKITDWEELRTSMSFEERYNWKIFRSAIRKVDLVVVILTPDETCRLRSQLEPFYKETRDQIERNQTRQNVILELGYLLALEEMGICRVAIFTFGQDLIPSDLHHSFSNIKRAGYCWEHFEREIRSIFVWLPGSLESQTASEPMFPDTTNL